MTQRFTGRRALVTGASRGIGAAAAERLAAEGADVAITARTLTVHDHLAGSLEDTAHRIREYGTTVAMVVADLTDERDRLRIVPEAASMLGGPIDILVNNAAAAIYQPVAGAQQSRGLQDPARGRASVRRAAARRLHETIEAHDHRLGVNGLRQLHTD
jgi:NAD(P)-dependent dehydrogenase (short-subunit alcohol dehydrogenase family)